MKIKTTASAFVAALKASVYEKKTSIPILSYVKVSGNRITGTDLDMFSIVDFEGENTSGDEEFTISPKQALAVLTGEKGDLTIQYPLNVETGWAKMLINGIEFKLPTMNVSNYPALPVQPAVPVLTVDGDEFRQLLSRTLFAISNEESRYTLNGGNLIADQKTVKLIATDGHRLALAETKRVPYKKAKADQIQTLITRDALNWLKTNVNGSVSVGIAKDTEKFHEWQTFRTGNKTLITRKLSGQFPNYEAIMPTNTDNRVTGTIPSAKKFHDVLTRVSKCADERSGAVKFHFAEKSKISASSTETGEATAPIDVSVTGFPEETKPPQIVIGLNSLYVLEFLKAVDETPVTVALRDPQSAALFSTDGGSYKYLIMPMRI